MAANHRASQADGRVQLEAVASNEELFDVAFNLLGASTEDLFFPANYLLVEGASDQVIVERALRQVGEPHGRIKVVAAGGVDAVPDTLAALERALLPVVMRDSPYADRVVALIDQPEDPESHTVAELERVLGDRLFRLEAPSLEEAVPEIVYERAALDRGAVVDELRGLRDDYRALHDAKRRVSRELARVLTMEDLAEMEPVRQAIERARAPVGDL
jgi:hypothetical protein